MTTRGPATAAGRTLWEGYQAVVAKRPDVDGILWLDAILAIETEAVAAFVWASAEATPGFNEEMAQGIADLEAGKGVPFSEIKREVTS